VNYLLNLEDDENVSDYHLLGTEFVKKALSEFRATASKFARALADPTLRDTAGSRRGIGVDRQAGLFLEVEPENRFHRPARSRCSCCGERIGGLTVSIILDKIEVRFIWASHEL